MFAHERSLVEKYQDKPFAFLGVNVDPKLETFQQAQEKHQLNWRSWWDGMGGPIAMRWKVESLPTLFLIDHKGDIRWKSVGSPDLKAMDEMIEKLLQEAEGAESKETTVSKK